MFHDVCGYNKHRCYEKCNAQIYIYKFTVTLCTLFICNNAKFVGWFITYCTIMVWIYRQYTVMTWSWVLLLDIIIIIKIKVFSGGTSNTPTPAYSNSYKVWHEKRYSGYELHISKHENNVLINMYPGFFFLPLGVASCCASIQLVLHDAVNRNKVSIR
jgi:hypothetical protein